MFLYADIINGVHENGDDDYLTNVMDQNTFYDRLCTLKEEEYITAFCSKEMIKKIDDEYGIKQNKLFA